MGKTFLIIINTFDFSQRYRSLVLTPLADVIQVLYEDAALSLSLLFRLNMKILKIVLARKLGPSWWFIVNSTYLWPWCLLVAGLYHEFRIHSKTSTFLSSIATRTKWWWTSSKAVLLDCAFSVTLAVVFAAISTCMRRPWLGVHKAKSTKVHMYRLYFFLALWLIRINKTFWVIALVIALANWKHIGQSISDVIRRGIQPKLQKSDSEQARRN